MWKVINVYGDRTNTLKHRSASRLEYEPSIAGVRLRHGHLMLLTDVQFLRIRPQLEDWKKKGMIDFAPAKGTEAPKPGVAVMAKEHHKIHHEISMLDQVTPYQSPLASETDKANRGHSPDGGAEHHTDTNQNAAVNQVMRHGYDPKLDSRSQNPASSAYRNVPESQPLVQDEVDRKIPSGDDGWLDGAQVNEKTPDGMQADDAGTHQRHDGDPNAAPEHDDGEWEDDPDHHEAVAEDTTASPDGSTTTTTTVKTHTEHHVPKKRRKKH